MATQKNPYEDPDPMADLIKQAMAENPVPGGEAVDPEAPQQPGPTGGGAEVPPPIVDPEVPTGGAPKPTYNYGNTKGYDEKKFNDPNKKSAKYQIGRTLSQFDPKQGITPEVLAALNALGFGTFSGQKDKLSLQGLTDAGKAAGLVGDYQDADFNIGFNTGNGVWGYSDPTAEALDPQFAAAGVGGGGGALSDPTLSLDQGGVPSDEGFFNQLMEALQKAQGGNVDRKALLERMGLG